jgi:hypothetical protein
MKKMVVVLLGGLFVLSGCSSPTEPVAEPTPTFDNGGANGVACRAFYDEFASGIGSMDGDSTIDDWSAISNQIDTIALKAEGDVKDRMLALVDAWPDMAEIFIFGEFEDFNGDIAAVERACDAAGENIDGMQLVESE